MNTSYNLSADFSLCVHSYKCKYLNHLFEYLPLDRVYCLKYLEVYLDYRLKFIKHIYYMNDRLRNVFYKFCLLKNMLDIRTYYRI